MKKMVLYAVVAATTFSSVLATSAPAMAQYYDRRPQGYGYRDQQPPPPPPRRRHHDNGAAIAGGIAAGVLGGLIGGAIANGDSGPRYIDPPPPPPPRCWFEDRPVQNAYDGGSHMESIRVCN
jgi:hypothetical protein